MATDRDREALRAALEPTLGAAPTSLLLEQLPPMPSDEIATRSDLRGMEARTTARFDHVDARFDQIDARFEQVDARFDQFERRLDRFEDRFDARARAVDARFDHLTEVWHERFDRLEATLTATFRGGLNAAIVTQTRVIVFSTLGAVVALGGVAIGLAAIG